MRKNRLRLMQLSTQSFIADIWVVTRTIRCLCLLLITGPCVTVMLDFDNFRVIHHYKRIGEIK